MTLRRGLGRSWVHGCAALWAVVSPAQPPESEHQVQAKIVRLFLGHVSWPTLGNQPLRLAVLGKTGLGLELETACAKGTVGGRPVQVRYMFVDAFLAENRDYDAVFIEPGEEGRIGAILAKTQGKPVLTLGKGEGLIQRGLMVNFYIENNRIRFEINPTRIRGANLVLSSHLLRLGRIVESGPS